MPLIFLRMFDRWVGGFLLFALGWPVGALSHFLSPTGRAKPRFVFLKLKGGGSLIIAMPALLGLRRAFPDSEFVLVCASEARIYAEMTGVFDRLIVIDDSSLWVLMRSGFAALRDCFRVSCCIDIEPNSLLAALFTMMTCATRRIGFVKPSQPARRRAYSDALAFDALAPIYIYYDEICVLLGGVVTSTQETGAMLRSHLPAPLPVAAAGKTIAIAAFTSDFARERMMPVQTWVALLQRAYTEPVNFLIFGAATDQYAAQFLTQALQTTMPACTIFNLAGAGNLAQAVARLALCDEIWAVDSGLLHLGRALGVPTRSFWGPTKPTQRLRPSSDLLESVYYRPFACSPCVQIASGAPCRGQNICMSSMAEENPDLHPAWVAKT